MRTAMFWLAVVLMLLAAASIEAAPSPPSPIRSLDGHGNNATHDDWGQSNTAYLRVAPTSYVDGVAKPPGGPSPRAVSNRVFNDVGQNLFSENGISQWGWAWGQFMDHDFGLRDERPGESMPLAFDAADPLEEFRNDFGALDFSRTLAAPNTGTGSIRQQLNTISSYIDGSPVYGVTAARLDWLRVGPADGDPTNNEADLLLTSDGYLPRVGARGNPATAPAMDLIGALAGTPTRTVVAGDVRANENIALTALHTLFAREHNRIVAALPATLPKEVSFQIARRVVGAEEQYVTYTEFLPALGVQLPSYRGYDDTVNAGLGNEFAVVGYRAHSMIHGEFEPTVAAGTYTAQQLDAFRAQGITVEDDTGAITLVIPLNVAFGNPDLLRSVGLGPILRSLGAETQYKNDEQIDNALRSVLFQVPRPGIPDPSVCGEPVVNPDCFTGVQDLGAVDVARARDHGIASYNDLRRAYGLSARRSFAELTGESTDRFPKDPEIEKKNPLDDLDILDFVALKDGAGNAIPLDSDEAREDAVVGVRRTTLAARLKALYGDVDRVDGFVGMVSEPHVQGTEFGELQLAIWRRQFAALRDGDRFFYANDPALRAIRDQFGIDYRQTLAQIIERNAGVDVQPDVFRVG